jgi:hypothetical protein
MNFVWSKPLDSNDLKMCALETYVPAQCKGRLLITTRSEESWPTRSE